MSNQPFSNTRRKVLQAATLPLLNVAGVERLKAAAAPAVRASTSRVRPSDAAWPSEVQWLQLNTAVAGALVKPHSPIADCAASPTSPACDAFFKNAQNPYFLSDNPALTQTLGWVDAWTSRTSPYAVAARTTSDVVAAVNFARKNNLRLVVKGGGHSYQGTSNAADSLLVWTRQMKTITLHDAFVETGCVQQAQPVRAVSIGAGALWAHVYDSVTTQAGGYVQGGGCMTVGVAGLVQSGGFGSFSKAFGLAAASLLEAEIVTADGQVRVANACSHPELFWGVKGGGGGSLGVVTRLTLRVHELPETFGAVNISIKAQSAPAFRRLIGLVMDFYSQQLMNPHWGEQIRMRPDNVLKIAMVFQGMGRSQAKTIWQPFLDAVTTDSQNFAIEFSPLNIVSTSAREFWAPTLLKRALGFIKTDGRPGAEKGNVFWPGDQGQAGQVLHGYGSAWLPAGLLQEAQRPALCDALFAASRHASVSLHMNKGLAGAPPAVLAAAKDTAMNPAVLNAFALVICGAEGPPAYPGIAGHEPDTNVARKRALAISHTISELHKLTPKPGSYLAESNYFEPNWQEAFWGTNYSRLLAVKKQYDPDGLFFVHHGVGSEDWSADGFSKLA
jgi:FAD binding domain/Berberine and berberine like